MFVSRRYRFDFESHGQCLVKGHACYQQSEVALNVRWEREAYIVHTQNISLWQVLLSTPDQNCHLKCDSNLTYFHHRCPAPSHHSRPLPCHWSHKFPFLLVVGHDTALSPTPVRHVAIRDTVLCIASIGYVQNKKFTPDMRWVLRICPNIYEYSRIWSNSAKSPQYTCTLPKDRGFDIETLPSCRTLLKWSVY